MRHLRPADYTVSDWSGGRTVQLSIGPEGERYADRKFLWRISSATVELETSEFTALPDYERLIAPIRGEMILSHNGGEEILLRPFDVHRFDGADLTISKGKCTDFNLMLRKGKVTGEMRAIRLGSGGQQRITPEMPGDTVLLYLAEGTARVQAVGGAVNGELPELTLMAGESVVLGLEDYVSGEVIPENAQDVGLELLASDDKGCVFMMAAVRFVR
ncbi:MAG: HutD family protein [Stomatobaculum sp.]|nr:HutD family protein [Stomatobaculum sp.]